MHPPSSRSNVAVAILFVTALGASLMLFSRLASGGVDAADLASIDAGVGAADRVVASDHALPTPMSTPPSVDLLTVSDGFELASWIWLRFKNGQAAAGLIVALQAIGLFAIRRWSWVSLRLPRLVRGKALAAVSSFTGTLATLVPVAVAGAPVATPLAGAVLAAVGVYLMPTPTMIAGQTVPSGEVAT